jgi:hypothetical protein
MIHRYLVMDAVPELRPEPGNPEKVGGTEVLVVFPPEVYWEVTALIDKIRYCKGSGESPTRYWKKLVQMIPQYIAEDRDRTWFLKNVGH